MTAILDRGDWMQTFTGLQFHPIDPHPDEIDIEDIAHALSLLCRFSGHVREFYSVAQHSIIVARILPPELKMAGLLHDATEAYIVDIPRPLKVALTDYKVIEHRLESVIAQKYAVDFSDPRIKEADNIALMTEARDLLGKTPAAWGCDATPLPGTILPWSPEIAAARFLKCFRGYLASRS